MFFILVKGSHKKPHLKLFVFESFYILTRAYLNMKIIKSTQFAIIQAFTALWETKCEQMATILNFVKEWNLMIIFKMNVKNYTEILMEN